VSQVRRVVTGDDGNGRAVFVADEPVQATELVLTPTRYHEIWRGDETPRLPTAGANGQKTTFFPGPNGYRFFILTIPAGEHALDYDSIDIDAGLKEMESKLPGILQWNELDDPGMHTTDTVDMEYVIAGEVTLELDDGVTKVLRPGDTIVQNGTRHRWHNRGTEDAVMAVVMIGAVRAS
jgi:mannose-6-phosphate isomerase-like protein (cupin superfamily)